MNKLFVFLFLAACFISCKNKKLDSTKAYFSVVDYLKSEVKKMDTLPLHFTKITTVDSSSDTVEITKKEFHQYADIFLDLPDISSRSRMDDYTEVNDFDEILNNVLLIYTAKDPEDEVRNETIMMEPNEDGSTHIKTILATVVNSEKDSTVERSLTWHVDKRLQIVTKLGKPNQPEKINTVMVNWE
jgi:hypothetical protein